MSCYILSNKKAYTKNIDRQGNTNEFRICAPKSEPVHFIFALVQLFSRYKNYFKAEVIIDKFTNASFLLFLFIFKIYIFDISVNSTLLHKLQFNALKLAYQTCCE